MKRWYSIAVVVLVLGLSILACGESTPVVRTSEPGPAGDDGEVEATEPPEEAPAVGTSRNNPAPAGSEVDVGDMTISIGDVIRPADEMIAEANQFNSEAEEGNEFILVDVILTCNKGSDEECSFFPSEFNVVGSSGVTREPELFIAGIDGMLESGEMFGGATSGGKLTFQVGVDETGLILIYEELFGSKVFLALPE